MNSVQLLVISAGVLIIAGLAWYAWSLTRQVKTIEKQRLEEETLAATNLRKHQQELVGDIHFVARSVLAEQCEITEGILRLHYLINALDPDTWALDQLRICRTHHGTVCDMPILEAYQKLSKKEQFRLDRQRWQLEETHKPDISKELQWLVDHSFPNITLLH